MTVAAPAPAGRLAPAWAALSDPRVRVLSTDFFDTLAWRKVPEPVDAFALIGRRLVAEERIGPRVDAAMFAKLRGGAEQRVRKRRMGSHGQSEIRLREIYAALPDWVLVPAQREAAVEAELAVERELLLPDLDVLELLRAAQASGRSVVAVSDTYYSERDLRSFLEQPLWDAPRLDRVLASSDHRVNKSGGLFEVLMREIGVEACAIFHLGDNVLGDVEFPRRLGIGTLLFERRDAELERVLHAEHRLQRPADDSGLTALRAKAHAHCARAEQPPAQRALWEFGATVAGPVLAGYADWVVTLARGADERSVGCGASLVAQLVQAAADGREVALATHVEAGAGTGPASVRLGSLGPLEPVWREPAGDAPPPLSFLKPDDPASARRARDLLNAVCAWPDPEQKHALHAGVIAFQRERLRYAAAFSGWLEPLDEAADVLLAVLVRAATQPTTSEAQWLGSGPAPGPHTDPADLVAAATGPVWDAAAGVHAASGVLLGALGDGIVEPAAISSTLEPAGSAVTVAGATVRPVRRNWLGLSRLTATIEPGAGACIAVEATGACAIRFDRIEVRPLGAPGIAPIRLTAGHQMRRLRCRDARWFRRVLLCRRRGAGLEIDVSELLGHSVDGLQVELDFELLDLSRA